MCNLVLELKEKHNRQKQHLLTIKKNGRRRQYEHRGTALESCEEPEASSQNSNALATGIVVKRSIFKEENIDINKDVRRRVSFGISNEENC